MPCRSCGGRNGQAAQVWVVDLGNGVQHSYRSRAQAQADAMRLGGTLIEPNAPGSQPVS
jgi:hypothetical protein